MFREAYNIPLNRIFELLEGFPPTVFVEVLSAVRDYCRYWDEHAGCTGFVPPEMSDAARIVWNGIKNKLAKSNEDYFAFCASQREKSRKAVEAKEKRREKRCREQKRYADRKEEINHRRRQKYASQKARQNVREAVDNLPKNGNKTMLKTFFVCHKKAADESPLNQADKGIAKNRPAGDRILGLNNNLVKHSVVIGERGYGGKQVIHKPPVDKFAIDNSPPDGLAGNNPVAAARGNNRPGAAGNTPSPPLADTAAAGCGQWAMGNGQREPGKRQPMIGSRRRTTDNAPPVGGNRRPPTRPSPGAGEGESSASVCVRLPSRAKTEPPVRWPPGREVVIGENFRLDFLDPELADLNFLDDRLVNAVESKLVDWKCGRSVEKWWIRRLIFKFAENQGRTESLSKELLRRADRRRRKNG